MVSQQRELQRRLEYSELQRRESEAQQRRRRPEGQAATNPSALLGEQIRRADPHVLEKRTPSRRRSKTLESALHPAPDANIQRQPSSARKRANTGPGPYKGSLILPEQFYRGVTFPQYPPGLRRISSKREGKMAAEKSGMKRERPSSRPQSRHRAGPGGVERTHTDHLMR